MEITKSDEHIQSERIMPSSSRWKAITSMPSVRWGAACVAINDAQFVMIGGFDEGMYQLSSAVVIYDVCTDEWKHLPCDMPTGRYDCGATFIDGTVYVIGGIVDDYKSISELLALNMSTRKWERLAPMTRPRDGFAVVAVDRYIYIFGGYDSEANEYLDSFARYSVDNDQWEEFPSMSSKRAGCAATVVGEQIYIIGGYDRCEWLSSGEIFNISSQQWDTAPMPNMLIPRTYCVAVSVGTFLVVIGGSRSSSIEIYETNYKSNSSTKERRWMLFPEKMTYARFKHAAVVLGKDRVVVIGGPGLSSVEQLSLVELT